MSAEPHIVIIGGGFSGAAVAIELLRLGAERGARDAAGAAPVPGPGWPTPLRSRRTGLTFRPLACSWPATKRAPSIIGTAISLPLPSMCRRCARDGSVYPQRGQFGRYVAQRFADAAASSGGRLRHLRESGAPLFIRGW
ncbi:FAD-dependent oxidoreductase [Klebsiella pneumoniae]|uniref:FAD-dependent oxidoreductase n=1 Tax=Klebsiella pneumoniae TaxID=573 RepID=A0A377TYI3_KLEPN|nr:FAD-dependent oxidoreductase [Klebsiella pneumoniae]